MTDKERIHNIVESICVYACRGSLEDEARPYFEALNRRIEKVPRGELEQYVFAKRALMIEPSGIYKIYVGDDLYKSHTYYSAFEVMRYILKRTDFEWAYEPEQPIDKATGKPVRIVQAGTLFL